MVIVAAGVGFANGQENGFKAGDKISLKIAGVPANEVQLVSGFYTVGDGGTLNLPHLASTPVRAAGVTRSSLEKVIEAAYRKAEIYTRPTIIINIDNPDGVTTRLVTVLGEVNRSGSVPFREGMTMLEAIAGAGDRSDFADMKAVRLFRDGKMTSHNLTLVGKNPSLDIKLKPYDRIMVREKRAFSFFD